MAKDTKDVDSLFEEGTDVDAAFEAGEDVLPEVSTSEGLLSGLQTGTALGFRDELAGAAGALGGKFGGDERPLSEIYKEAKAEELAEMQRVAEGAPKATLAGSVVGSGLLAGLTAPVAALKGTSLGRAAITGGAQAAKAGALLGSLQGLGESEAEDITGTLSDVGTGAALGGTLGGLAGAATPVAAAGLSKIASGLSTIGGGARKLLKATDFTDDLAASVEEGLKGKLVFGEGAKRRVERGVVEAQKEAEDQLLASLKEAGEAKAAALRAGESLGERVDTAPIYQKALQENLEQMGPTLPEKEASSRLQKELMNLLDESDLTNLTAIDRQKRGLQRLSKMGMERDAYPQSPETSAISRRVSTQVKEALEKPFEETTGENILRAANRRFEAAKEAEELLPQIQEVSKLSKDFQPALRNKFEQFSSLIDEASPEAKIQSVMTGSKPLVAKLTGAAEEFERVKRLSRGGISGMEQIWGAVATLPAKTLNLTALGANKATTTVNDAIRGLGNIPKQQVLTVADWYEKAGLTGVSSLVRQAAEKEGNAKNAALFMLSQNPDFKRSIFGDEPKEE